MWDSKQSVAWAHIIAIAEKQWHTVPTYLKASKKGDSFKGAQAWD